MFPSWQTAKENSLNTGKSGLAINVIQVNRFEVETNNNCRQQCLNVLTLPIMRLSFHFLITLLL